MKRKDGIRITMLVENTASGERILGEHGLSVWVETVIRTTAAHCFQL